MNRLPRINYARGVFVLSILLLAVSAAWAWRMQRDVRRVRMQTVAARVSGPAYRAVEESASVAAADFRWPASASPAAVKEWGRELFTPPLVYYDETTRSFTTGLAVSPGEEGRPFDFDVLEIKWAPYPLQLVGWLTGADGAVAVFEHATTTGTLLAHEGHRFADLGLTLKRFTTEKVIAGYDDGRPVYEIVARAELEEAATGRTILLDSRARKFSETPVTVLRLGAGDDRVKEQREGDQFEATHATYRIERIQPEERQITVSRQTGATGSVETKTLHLVSRVSSVESSHPALAGAVPFSPAMGLAGNR